LNLRVSRLPLLAAGILSAAYGIWMGLLRLGWVLPLPWPDQLILHGPLMIGGFLGTVIGLERAIGVGKRWAYAAPVCAAAGALALVFGPPGAVGPLLITASSAVVVAIFLGILLRQPSLFVATMLAGAVCWAIGNVRWLAGASIYRVVFWWIGFVVLTIAGERLELNRLLKPRRHVRFVFVVSAAGLVVGIAAIARWPDAGVRLTGAALIAMGLWLGSFDIARRTIRQTGVTRFIAGCLLSGYLWLAFGGVVAVTTGVFEPGPTYDAILHAIFLGFAMVMVFGHAPIVFPAVVGRPMRFSQMFYAHVVILHASLAARMIGDLVPALGTWRAWGGLLNAVAVFAFVGNSAWGIARSR
jgi:hypothetical protein